LKGGENMKKNTQSIIIGVLVVIIVGAASFFGGMKYQQSKSLAGRPGMGQFANGGNMRFQGANRTGAARGGFGGLVTGDVVASDANSITVKLSDGSSKIVNLTNSTTYSKTDTASKSDVTNGTKVAIMGATNSDGSVTATNVEINPPQRKGMPSKGTVSPQVSK
jgi:hypothetical protein